MAAASQYIRVAEAGRHCRLRLQAVVVCVCVFSFSRVATREDVIGAFFCGGWGEVNTNMVSTDGISHRSCKRTCDTFLQQVLGGSETHADGFVVDRRKRERCKPVDMLPTDTQGPRCVRL